MKTKIKVAFVSSEVSPLAKVGGLADVVGSLPKSFDQSKVDSAIFIPAYSEINLKSIMAETVLKKNIQFLGSEYKIQILKSELPNSKVPLFLVSENSYLSQGPIYGKSKSDKEGETFKFLLFSKAVLESFSELGWVPDIIHTHDWPTAPLCVMVKSLPESHPLSKVKTVLTIHNINHQNYAGEEMLRGVGIKIDQLDPSTKSESNSQYYNLFAQSILSTDRVNTVSPQYAKEILTAEYGVGMDKFLKTKAGGVVGVLNGIDVDYYDPSTDQSVYFRYSSKNLDEKAFNKTNLQKMFGLEIDVSKMLAGGVTRIDNQKGIELVLAAADELKNENIQFILLGTGDEKLSKKLQQLAKKQPKSFVFINRYDHPLARKIYASSDIFLMPSRFEPCGLTQLIAMRYGSLPLVRDTGGLHDTVKDHKKPGGYGFVFGPFTSEALTNSILEAQKLFQLKNVWRKLQLRAMEQDFSWNRSAGKYLDMYQELVN